jgi:hypothetical protein
LWRWIVEETFGGTRWNKGNDVRSLVDSDCFCGVGSKRTPGLLTKHSGRVKTLYLLPDEAAEGSNLAEVHPLPAVHKRSVQSRERHS